MVSNECYICIKDIFYVLRRIHNKQALYVSTEEGFNQVHKGSEEINRIYHDNSSHTITNIVIAGET
jgi:hypothetical protein